MIFTRIKIDNLFCFEDTELDLTYPRKIKDSTIEYEYLDRAENFRFKRLCIISGANASGKTSFGKILCELVNIIKKGKQYLDQNLSVFMPSDAQKDVRIEADFLYPTHAKLLHRRLCIVIKNSVPYFQYGHVPITKNSSVESCCEKLFDIFSGEKIRGTLFIDNTDIESSFHDWKALQNALTMESEPSWAFLLSGIDRKSDNPLIDGENEKYKERLLSILKTFDPSIQRISASYDEESHIATEFTIHFNHGKYCKLDADGTVDSKYSSLLSSGTYQGITVAGFIHFLLMQMDHKNASGIFFLDEKMSYSHSEVEKAIVNLIVQKLNRYSQFFYTTHNYDILEMDFPLHSFVFLKKDNGFSKFVNADLVCNKNDRSILPFVKANYFNTIPDTHLLDDLLWQE